MNIFEYAYMQRAFLVGIMIAIITPCIGMIVVTKRLSMIGDALSHTSLAGVALGLILNINPVFGAVGICIVAALCIEAVRKKIPKFSEMSIAIIMSAGIGLAGVLSGYVKTSANFNSFLFGSISSISPEEVVFTPIISIVVIISFIFLYRDFFYVVFDERAARLSGVKVKTINFIFTLLTAVTVSVATRVVGALIVSSLMVIPVACSMQSGKSFKTTLFFSIIYALFFTVSGLFLSFYIKGLKTSGTIVLLGVVCFIILLLINKFKKHRNKLINAKNINIKV